MSTVLLRRILSAGFCGGYTPTREIDIGSIHHALDCIIADGDFEKYSQQTYKVQACGQKKIPYSEHGYFLSALDGIFQRKDRLATVKSTTHEVDYLGSKIVFTLFREGDVFVDPMYEFYYPQHLIPLYTIVAAFLAGVEEKAIKVRSVSMMTDFEEPGEFAILREDIDELLNSHLKGHIRAGSPCTSCSMTGCKFPNPFEQAAVTYFKAKQAFKEAEEVVKKHLIYHGPTKAGAHLVYMKENRRRFFKDKDWTVFLEALMKADPKGYLKYLSPDAKDIAEAVKRGTLPAAMLKFFSTSRYHTIETSVSM